MTESLRITDGLAVLEVTGLAPSLVILDAAEKASGVRLLQAELNDFYGVCMKLLGDAAALRSAVSRAKRTAEHMGATCVSTIIDAPDPRAWSAIESPREYQPLIEQDVVFIPNDEASAATRKDEGSTTMAETTPFAIGLIETQGFTAVIEAIDTACKAADVEVIGKEKLGGGYVTILIKGDVAAVKVAVEAGRRRVGDLGKLIAAHVIPRPSPAVLSLLP
jgi:microcompartment protein CcmL/EutN